MVHSFVGVVDTNNAYIASVDDTGNAPLEQLAICQSL
jgi:hypothetical protein